MTEIQKHPNTMQVSPFQEEIAVENFYAGANRDEVLHRMTAALEEGVALMVLSGEEGSGKTMLCRMLESQTTGAYITVLFSRTVESFEDVVKIVAKRMGVGLEGGNDGKSIDGLLDRITSRLMQESSTLLIIFDEAENIYLATLERIRKMLDRLTHAGARISIVFAGRRTFLENCDQLSICDFKNTAELHFVLAPLTELETGDYLRDCALRLENPDRRKIFNDEITRNIFSLAKGNFRVTNLLAEESLRTHGDDTSFMVLLESVTEEVEAEEDDDQQEMPHLIKRYGHYFPWIGGVGCIALLLFFLVKPDSGDRNSAVEQAVVQKESVVEEKATEVGKPLEEETAETTVTDPPPAASATAEKITVSEAEKPVDKGPTVVETVAQTSGSGVQPLPPPVKARIRPPPPVKIPVLRQDQPLKRKPQSDTAKGGKGPVRMQPRTEAKVAIASSTQLTVDQLLQKRLAAGAALAKRGMESAYTMQLMVLTDKNAEDNLKKMLAQPQYRKEAGNFFIYKRTGRSDIIFVFYGEYPNVAAARLAQDNLPVFLRVHQPYAISVKGALAKVKK
jgi:type II secretory pathway predicted ATPase ExeA/septal ring-binding cell division protein DamX